MAKFRDMIPQDEIDAVQNRLRRFAENPIYRVECQVAAKNWANADRADPFAYGKAMSDFRSGVAEPGKDYKAGWRVETHEYYSQVTGEIAEYGLREPINMAVV